MADGRTSRMRLGCAPPGRSNLMAFRSVAIAGTAGSTSADPLALGRQRIDMNRVTSQTAYETARVQPGGL
eukprot:4610457-Prymnesium_polylepis.1